MINDDNSVRVGVADQALVNEARSGLHPAGFDPSRYENKPRWLPRPEQKLLRALLDAMEERLALMSDREQTGLLCGCLNVSPINCAWDEYAMAAIVYHSVSHDVANRRDSDEHPEGENAKRLSGEAMPARAVGIAQPQPQSLLNQEKPK